VNNRETGWLLERQNGFGQTEWLYLYELERPGIHVGHTTDASKALRFARECDARAFRHTLHETFPGTWEDVKVTDHEWFTEDECRKAFGQ
jgi:hypothetical protein